MQREADGTTALGEIHRNALGTKHSDAIRILAADNDRRT
jgi:hypothetical protein